MKVYKIKFKRGDRVKVSKDLGKNMSHFPGAGKEAVILYTYYEECGGWCGQVGHGSLEEKKQYAINIKGHGFSAWYDESQLTLIRKR